MSLVRLESIVKRFGGDPVLEGVDLRIEEGEKVGLIGRNGTGKSTIFRLIMGEMEPDSGVIERMRRARFAYLAQLPDLDVDRTIHEVVLDQFAELIQMERRLLRLADQLAHGEDALMEEYSALQETFHHRGGYEFHLRVERVLTGLGFSRDEFDLPVGALSGGQRTRLLLAMVLLEDADLLLLDEPENHLDLRAREWLEAYLRDSPRAFVIISHDRRMLNAVVARVVDLERGRVRSYTGNYDAYLEAKELASEQQADAFARQQKEIERQEAWINRFRYKSSKARQVQARVRRLEKLDRVDAPDRDAARASLQLGTVVRAGAKVIEAEGLAMAYGDLRLYEDVDLCIERGERVGIIGPNGSGKTTLLRHLAGRLPNGEGACRGEVRLGPNVRLGFYEQQHETLNRANDILTELRQVRPDWTPERIRTFMGRLLFTGEDIFKPIGALSGGELSRVSLAKLVLSDANTLLLDEPTNHLDIATREVLEGALSEYEGTLVIVSHDRELIDRLVERLIIVDQGRAAFHLGNYTHYRQGESDAASGPVSADDAQEVLRIRSKRAKAKNKEAARQEQNRERRNRRRLSEVESDIAEMEELVNATEARFVDLDPSDYIALSELTEEYENLKADLRALYEAWEELAAELEGD